MNMSMHSSLRWRRWTKGSMYRISEERNIYKKSCLILQICVLTYYQGYWWKRNGECCCRAKIASQDVPPRDTEYSKVLWKMEWSLLVKCQKKVSTTGQWVQKKHLLQIQQGHNTVLRMLYISYYWHVILLNMCHW